MAGATLPEKLAPWLILVCKPPSKESRQVSGTTSTKISLKPILESCKWQQSFLGRNHFSAQQALICMNSKLVQPSTPLQKTRRSKPTMLPRSNSAGTILVRCELIFVKNQQLIDTVDENSMNDCAVLDLQIIHYLLSPCCFLKMLQYFNFR